MHLIVGADLKAALDLMRYLKSPTKVEHLSANRFFCAILLTFKFIVGLATEALFILSLSKIEENVIQSDRLSPSMMILLTFVIFVVIYEAPNLYLKSRISLGDSQYATSLW